FCFPTDSVCRTENLDLVVQPLEEEIIDDYGDRVLYAILGGDSEGLREILHSSADRRVPHLALAQALLLKDQQHSTACLAITDILALLYCVIVFVTDIFVPLKTWHTGSSGQGFYACNTRFVSGPCLEAR
ncbi:hypothetical protein BaRGS_00037893, partial [Batillaria attramentaria]